MEVKLGNLQLFSSSSATRLVDCADTFCFDGHLEPCMRCYIATERHFYLNFSAFLYKLSMTCPTCFITSNEAS